MRLIVIAGFLGAGKTTFIIRIAEAALKKNKKVAILVNEIGDIGIDDQYMRQLGLNVHEILGGCICCTLKGSLQSELIQIASDHKPDLVILEPSGAADLKFVDEMVENGALGPVFQLNKVTLVDPLRLKMAMTVLTPLITSQIQSAEWVIITKEDAATHAEMEYARRTIKELNAEASTLSNSPRTGLPGTLADALLS